MVLIDTVCCQNKGFSQMLKSPIIKTDKKLKILEDVFGSKLNPETNLFVKMITTKKREGLLVFVAKSFIELYKKHNKIITVKIITATTLSEQLKKEVISLIKSRAEKKVELIEKVDPNILGGIIVRMGDKQLDLSVSKSIHKLRQVFNKNLHMQEA